MHALGIEMEHYVCIVSRLKNKWHSSGSRSSSKVYMLKLNVLISMGCTCRIYAGFAFRVKEHVNDSIFSWKLFSWIHFEMQWLCPQQINYTSKFSPLEMCVCVIGVGRSSQSKRAVDFWVHSVWPWWCVALAVHATIDMIRANCNMP